MFIFVIVALSVSNAQAKQPNILVLGDSLSAGYGMDIAQSWPMLLQERLNQKQLGYRVINASVSGDTTRTALNRLPQALEQHQPVVVIISLGGNDGLRGIPLSEMQNSLRQMVLLSQRHQARVLLAGVRLPPNYGKVYIERFSQVYETLASDTNSPLVRHLLANVAENPGLMQDDGLHPNAEGQPQILDNIWPSLVPLLKASLHNGDQRPSAAANKGSGIQPSAASTSAGTP
jgi:acyl-CoA thioesterase-1